MGGYSPPYVDRIWGIWRSYFNIARAIFYLLEGLKSHIEGKGVRNKSHLVGLRV